MVNGKLVPSPEEYEEVGFNLRESLYYFIVFYLLIFLPILAFHQETVNPGASINKIIRKYVYNQGYMLDYMGQNPLPFKADVEDCDWESLTPKQFFN
jgi:hypothetical protein